MLMPQVLDTPQNICHWKRGQSSKFQACRLKRGNPDTQQDDKAKWTRYYQSEDSEEDEPDKALAEEFDLESYYHAN